MVKDSVRHFFYNKNGGKTPRKNCFWIQYKMVKYLVSYQTVVCSVDDTGLLRKYWNHYSSTTMNQINQFIGLFGYNMVARSDTGEIITGFSKKDWLAMETSSLSKEAFDYIRPYIPDIEYGVGYSNDYVYKITYAN